LPPVGKTRKVYCATDGLLRAGLGRGAPETELFCVVFWRKRKGDHRYYLLPGMGRSNRRKRRQYFRSALLFGAIVSVILGSLLYYFGRLHL